MADIRAPFPWFGGKSRVAHLVWPAFSADVNNYVEPFCGSLAILLGRPGGPGKIETVNDADRFLANFWRAVRHAPLDVAKHADWPVNEADLHARHLWLVNQQEFRERMHADPDYFDAKIAGYWVWGICQWIGGGWCAAPKNGEHPKLDGAAGLGGAHAYSPGRRPQISSAGQGVHLPSLGNDRGMHGVAAAPAADWFLRLQQRLRRVRVACGDWRRVLGPSVLGKGKNVGGRRPCAVFLDPPYDPDLRCRYLYTEDAPNVSAEVREWALEHGDDPDLRIALCGYAGEHEMPNSWRALAWKASRGYAGSDNDNSSKERIWLSPHCLDVGRQTSLFDEVANG